MAEIKTGILLGDAAPAGSERGVCREEALRQRRKAGGGLTSDPHARRFTRFTDDCKGARRKWATTREGKLRAMLAGDSVVVAHLSPDNPRRRVSLPKISILDQPISEKDLES
jgi:hypothetical protein